MEQRMSFLFSFFIKPIELLFEVVFGTIYRMTNNVGFSIAGLSLVMNIIVLPLYKQAESMQEKQRTAIKKLAKWEKHIKTYFLGMSVL